MNGSECHAERSKVTEDGVDGISADGALHALCSLVSSSYVNSLKK